MEQIFRIKSDSDLMSINKMLLEGATIEKISQTEQDTYIIINMPVIDCDGTRCTYKIFEISDNTSLQLLNFFES